MTTIYGGQTKIEAAMATVDIENYIYRFIGGFNIAVQVNVYNYGCIIKKSQ